MPKYTSEKNVEMLISLLKQYNIKKIVISPGTTSVSFVGSVQTDDFFEIYSCVDERSACYMACGLAEETGEIVALSCTGATASRNYIPGLTEAYYRKLPILAITSAQFRGNVGHNIPQTIDRTEQLKDIVKLSVQVPTINNNNEEWLCNVEINKALLELNHNGKGPVHINLETTYSRSFEEKELTKYRKINRYKENDVFPEITGKKIGIFVGAHSIMEESLEKEIDKFCRRYNAVVICDRTSNYFGEYRVMANIVVDQDNYTSNLNNFDLIIHIGNISGAYMKINTHKVWRVNPDGKLIDTFKKLENIFEIEEKIFFERYNDVEFKIEENKEYYKLWKEEIKNISSKIEDNRLHFCNLWIAKQMINKLPNKSIVHLGILNTLRSWNYFESNNIIYGYSNTGGFGIDGIPSTLIGASLGNKNKIYYGILGDLAFFYDLNSLANKNVKSNIRILLINNGGGTEFHTYINAGKQSVGEKVGDFIAADGHFGNKSSRLVKDYVENLGYEYLTASTKEEFLEKIDYFASEEEYEKPILFEVFTKHEDENDSLKYIRNLKANIKGKIKSSAIKVLSPKSKERIKKLIGR